MEKHDSAMAACSARLDSYGFERPEDFDYKSYDDFMATYLRVLVRRARKWQGLLGKNKTITRCLKVKRYVRKGIPSEHRGTMWTTISGAQRLKNENEGVYAALLERKLDAELVNSINLDIPRTFPDNIYFQKMNNGQLKALYNVLVAFGHYTPHVGYCQGLNYIAGLLLLVVKEEEMTFWLLTVLINQILPDYYTKGMEGLLMDIDVLEELVKLKVPALHAHVHSIGISWPIIATKWFICLYAEVLPIETILRIWDCLFYEGNKILFRVALTLLKRNEQELLETSDFSQLTECLKKIVQDPLVLDCHNFMQSIFKEPGTLSRAQIERLREGSSQFSVSS